MYIKTDDDHNIIQFVKFGDADLTDPHWAEIQYDEHVQSILPDIFSYKFIDGEFIKRDDADSKHVLEAKEQKIKFLSEMCQTVIENGIQIGDNHYSLTTTDQMNLSKLANQAMMMPELPLFYHSDGHLCHQYTPEQITQIATAGVAWVTYHTTYFNFAKAYIESLTDFDTIASFKYGSQIADQSLYEQMTVITSTTQVVFDNEIDDPFDYDTLKNPMADFFQDPGEEEEIFIPQTIFDDPGDEYVEEVPTYEEEPVYEEPVQESDL